MPVNEDYGNLHHGTAGFVELVGNLYLERVAVGLDPGQVQLLQGLPPEGLESAGGILHRKAGHHLRVSVGEPGEKKPRQGPVHHVDPAAVPGPDGQVVFLQCVHQLSHFIRVMGKNRERVVAAVKQIAYICREQMPENQVLGPSSAPVEKVKENFRWQILLKFKRDDDEMMHRVKHILVHAIRNRRNRITGLKILLNADPVSMN